MSRAAHESAIYIARFLRRSRRRVRNHVTLVTDATAAFSLDGMKAAATNAPMFARATEALMSRLPTVNG
jgi:nicotinamidase-related amidase